MAAAQPVLAGLADSLVGSGYAFILGDRQARVLHRFGDSRRTTRIFEQCSAAVGVSFEEAQVGTNALGTAIETRSPVIIRGTDHFNHQLHALHCVAYPILHPLTRRVVGALDLTGTDDVAHPVITAMMRQVVQNIEERLLDASRRSHRELLSAFDRVSRTRDRPVVGIADDLLLANRPALDILQGNDFAVLRSLAAGTRAPGWCRSVDLTLTSGTDITLEVTTAPGGALLSVADSRDLQPRLPRARGERHLTPATAAMTLVSGPPGSGRTTRAAELADNRTVVMVEPHLARQADGQAWSAALHRGVAGGPNNTLIVLEDIDLVPPSLIAEAVQVAAARDRPDIVVVADQPDELRGRAAVLVSMCTRRIALAPLADRNDEMHLLARRMLQEVNPGSDLHLSASALEALAAHHWPGNLHELRTVLATAAGTRTTGDIALTDLPEGYRSTHQGRALSGIERAERDAIVRALATASGNKRRAAMHLGISRTTLYSRMRQLRITG